MASVSVVAPSKGLVRRPMATGGFWSWFTTVDHKKIGIMYGISAFVFFVIGGLEALLIRAQLYQPDGTLLNADQYNQIFTTHGITMVFLFVMPMAAAFFNYLIPLMIGARDVAFPRLNAFSFWAFILGAMFLYSSAFLGGLPNCGWFCYAPNSTTDPTSGATFYALGLLIAGIASTVGAVNLAVTVINLRAPGMSLFRVPVLVWMGLVVQLLLVFSLPIITVALFQLLFDRRFNTAFFDPTRGGEPLLWQHMFWLFGHPEVYVLILPAFAIFSEILPVFSRKPLFGYQFVVFSGIAIGFIGFGVWAHHMYAAGLGPVANTAFGISTAIIGVPTGIKIFNWMATMYKGDLRLQSPMLFCIGGIMMFVIGGLSGVTHSIVPSDYQQTDTYYVVAHFHYVIFGGGVFAFFGGLVYWWPKVFARMFPERLSKLVFWLMLIGFNLTFGPMHILGLGGMIRRTYTYPEGLGLTLWNQLATVGSFIIALSVAIFALGAIASFRKPKGLANEDPWDARTLEWMTACPPAAHNFDEIPTVHALDEFWHRKYAEDKEGRLVRVPAGASDHEPDGHGVALAIHLPSPSFWPLVAALGLPVMSYGVIYSWWLIGIGAIITVTALMGWAMEPSVAEEH
ncbi:MAG: cytochrome c oxidase subunit I [Actinomycetota bacterium]